MKERYFKQNDLKLYDWQYMIRHIKTNCFKRGEKVFLKSNPEHLMTVYSINEKSISTIWYNVNNEIQISEFAPECILQYKYAGLIICLKKFYVNLN